MCSKFIKTHGNLGKPALSPHGVVGQHRVLLRQRWCFIKCGSRLQLQISGIFNCPAGWSYLCAVQQRHGCRLCAAWSVYKFNGMDCVRVLW